MRSKWAWHKCLLHCVGVKLAAVYIYMYCINFVQLFPVMSMHAEMVVFLSFLFISHFVFTSCYIIRSPSPVPVHVFLNNNYKSIRNYFYYERARTLQIKSGHIAYFSSDAGERWAISHYLVNIIMYYYGNITIRNLTQFDQL